MAVVVTDNRTIYDEADTITGWTGGATAGATVFVEAPNSIISTLNIATGQIYFTGGAINLTNTLVYVWSNNFALQGSWLDANPPNALHLGDGTDRISFKMAGQDRKVFSHLTDQSVDWDCLVLDGSQASTMNTNGLTVARAGSFAGLNLAAITQIGVDFTTLSKGLGGGVNVAVDIIRYGNNGITVTGGTTGDRGTFLEVVIEDRSTATGKAHGIIREYSTGIYGVQGPITFGAATGDSWFQDDAVTVAFENRDIGNDKYYLAVDGGTGSNNFILTNSAITTAGPFVRCDFDGTSIETFTMTGNTFSQLGNAITFASDASAASHTVTGNSFTACGQINPGEVIFENNTISATTAGTTGALLLNTPDATNLQDITFNSGGTGHAIYITATGTYNLTGFVFNGYGANDTTNAAIYNNSGGAVTINIAGGLTPTVRNGAGASTTVNNNVTVTITVQDANTDPITGAVVAVFRTSDNVELANDETNVSGVVTFSTGAGTPVYIRVRKSTTGSTRYVPVETVGNTGTGLSLTVTLQEDIIAAP